MYRQPFAVLLAVLVLVITALAGTRPAYANFNPGRPGLGDEYFPDQGNSGYDVESYDLRIRTDPRQTVMSGIATLKIKFTTALSDYLYLDLRGLDVATVEFDGAATSWVREGMNLRVSLPPAFLPEGSIHTIRVDYSGTPVEAPRDSALRNGWLRTLDGVITVDEPNGASTWFPSNDYPTDKANYSITVTVPAGVTAVANGLPGRPHVGSDGWITTTWKPRYAMATYQVVLAIGDFQVRRRTSPAGIPVLDAVGGSNATNVEPAELKQVDPILRFLSAHLGRYPFEATGAIVASDNFGTALETQTRPIYSGRFFVRRNDANTGIVIAHEQAHQWFGDRISIDAWRDIWLNEGFATYMQWWWSASVGQQTLADSYNEVACEPDSSPVWSAPANPRYGSLFGLSQYERGAATLYVLRKRVGAATFNQILRSWAQSDPMKPHSTADFIALADAISGQDLSAFFHTWIYTPGKPAEAQCRT